MRNYPKISSLIAAATFILFTIAGCVSRKQVRQPFFFIQMTDPQFGFFNANKDFVKETENFEKAIKEANRLHPDYVIITGDLINSPGDKAQIAEYKRIVAKLDKSIPVYHIAGNHDVTNDPKPEDIEGFNKNFGPDYFSIKHKGTYGIVLNSLYFKSPSGVQAQADAQDIWLRNELLRAKKDGASTILIFQHHSWFLKDPLEKNDYFNIDLATRKKYLDLFAASGVSHVFAGHYHRNAFGKSGNIEMVTTGPVGKPLGKDPSGFRIISINGNKVTHKYYNLDSIPDQATLSQ
ncbi:metallophosphoesterase [Pedobacter sp. CG_S7]|uniref:metallophosphoesterase n=1 Tax=Pedobacter sp. CG_S7 TaxID=3143930 RepID=UPI0033920457